MNSHLAAQVEALEHLVDKLRTERDAALLLSADKLRVSDYYKLLAESTATRAELRELRANAVRERDRLMSAARADTEAGVLMSEYGGDTWYRMNGREMIAAGIARGWALAHSARAK